MISFKPVDTTYISQLMAIENACHSHPWTEKTMLSCLAGRYFNLAAFQGDEMLGFYIGEQAGPDYTLMDICVAPKYQGQGIAKQLLNAFIEHGEQHQAENLFLEVRESNAPAIGLYESAGFSHISVRKNYYPTATGNEDAILMGMSFSL